MKCLLSYARPAEPSVRLRGCGARHLYVLLLSPDDTLLSLPCYPGERRLLLPRMAGFPWPLSYTATTTAVVRVVSRSEQGTSYSTRRRYLSLSLRDFSGRSCSSTGKELKSAMATSGYLDVFRATGRGLCTSCTPMLSEVLTSQGSLGIPSRRHFLSSGSLSASLPPSFLRTWSTAIRPADSLSSAPRGPANPCSRRKEEGFLFSLFSSRVQAGGLRPMLETLRVSSSVSSCCYPPAVRPIRRFSKATQIPEASSNQDKPPRAFRRGVQGETSEQASRVSCVDRDTGNQEPQGSEGKFNPSVCRSHHCGVNDNEVHSSTVSSAPSVRIDLSKVPGTGGRPSGASESLQETNGEDTGPTRSDVYVLIFTCNPCGKRSAKKFSKVGKGAVKVYIFRKRIRQERWS